MPEGCRLQCRDDGGDDGPEAEADAGRGLGALVETSVQDDKARSRRASNTDDNSETLFGKGGPVALLQLIEPLPDIRRLMALQVPL